MAIAVGAGFTQGRARARPADRSTTTTPEADVTQENDTGRTCALRSAARQPGSVATGRTPEFLSENRDTGQVSAQRKNRSGYSRRIVSNPAERRRWKPRASGHAECSGNTGPSEELRSVGVRAASVPAGF